MFTRNLHLSPNRRQRGITLVELIMFIIVVGVGLTGVLLVLNATVVRSADPIIRKNLLSIAEAVLEEVSSQPYTNCDPTDANWASATSAVTPGQCATVVQGLGPGGTGQVRIHATSRFNNVADYHNASGHNAGATGLGDATHPILDVGGNATNIPLGYAASISIVPEALGGIASGTCASASDCTAMNAVRIAVTVTNGGQSLTLEGYRARYWPNDVAW